MAFPVILVGATGDLGSRILLELVRLKAEVRCLVRAGTPVAKQALIRESGAHVVCVDFDRVDELAGACQGGAVLVSAVAGLEDGIAPFSTEHFKTAISTVARGSVEDGRRQDSGFCGDLEGNSKEV